MAWFGDNPYLIVNTVYGPRYFAHPEMIQQEEESIQRFWFSGPLQRIAGGVETTELFIKEFARMWPAVDIPRWQSPPSLGENRDSEISTWLR